jgi:type I restriction enzyme M protein
LPEIADYVSTFLISKYGLNQIYRVTTGTAQPTITSIFLKTIKIPIFNEQFQSRIVQINLMSRNILNQSKELYQQAENLLLTELGLKDWQPTEESIAVKSFSESFLSSGRLDAEYYQPKYDQALAQINSLNPSNIIQLEDILVTITNGHTPLRHDLSLGNVKFLTAEHIDDFQINYETQKRILLFHHHNELKRTQIKNGDILITIKGKVGNAAVVENLNKLVNINQDVALLRLKSGFNPYYLIGFLNSQLGKLLIEKASTGQINPFLSLGALKKLSIPVFSENIMENIGNLIQLKVESFNQTNWQSKQLLEIAKIGVEKAIETDEETATAWINQQLESLGVKLIR